MDFGDLKDDQGIKEKISNFNYSLEKIQNMLEIMLSTNIYDNLTVKEKVDYDLFVAFAFNTLFWLYLRTRGEDPNSNEIKNQLTRIKEHMFKAKQAHERNTIRPKIDQPVAERLVKHGLSHKQLREDSEPANKKFKIN